MIKIRLAIYIIFLKIAPLLSQSINDSIIDSRVLSIYTAPLTHVTTLFGNSFRGGVQVPVLKNKSIFYEHTYYYPDKNLYEDLEGSRVEFGLKIFPSNNQKSWNYNRFWYSFSIGGARQQFVGKGTLFSEDFSSSTEINANYKRRVEFIHIGAGGVILNNSRWFIDAGVRVGIRHRDLDIEGLSENEENELFRHRALSPGYNASVIRSDIIIPDFILLLRVGFLLQKKHIEI